MLNYQLAGKFHVGAIPPIETRSKVVGTHAGAKFVYLKFFSAKKYLRTVFVALWMSKRTKLDTLETAVAI